VEGEDEHFNRPWTARQPQKQIDFKPVQFDKHDRPAQFFAESPLDPPLPTETCA
jgi:hypothetical protein